MVLKEQEEICIWFKNLNPRKRIEYMCGLLQLCLPLELRFIGTVLEDCAKKDFNQLRDAENKANNPTELSNNESQGFGDHQFRAKILLSLTLMHSANTTCADIIFRIIERQFNSLTAYFHDEKVFEEILTILTIACHHPAFKTHQTQKLAEVLKNTEDHCCHHHQQWGNHSYIQMQQHPKNSHPYMPIPALRFQPRDIVSIAVKSINRDDKKTGPLYEIVTTWSNGEITESLMMHSKLQELSQQIFNKFPDTEKLRSLFQEVSGPCRRQQESREKRVSLMNTYLSELSLAHHILNSDIVTQAFHNGNSILPVQMVPATIYNYQDPRLWGYPDAVRVPCFPPPNTMSVVRMPNTGMSSSTTSPSNSRSSSPSGVVNNRRNIKAVADKGVNLNQVKSGLQYQVIGDQDPQPQEELRQFLKLASLEKYYEKFDGYSLEELVSMSPEDLTRLDIPHDDRNKLQSRLDSLRHTLPNVNGLIPQHSSDSKYERLIHSFPAWPGQGHISPESGQQLPLPYPPYHLFSQVNAIQSLPPSDNSPSASELCTPSLSPGLHSMTDSPPSLASPTSVYLEDKNLKNHQVDSSGSDDDKIIAGSGFEGIETTTHRNRGPPGPQQSISLPILNHNATSLVNVERGKVTNVPVSLSAPLMNSDVTRDGGTPPMVPIGIPIVNGFAENPLMHPNVIPQVLHHQHRYKSAAQPAHTGPRMHKNVMNMPCLDMTSQPPPPAPGMNKSNGIMHHPMLHYVMPPNLPGNPGIIHSLQPNNCGAPQQMPAGQAMLPPSLPTDNGGSMGNIPIMHNIVPSASFMTPHSRGILTTMSNSTVVISTTQSHSSGQQPIATSHSPSPVASSVPADQAQINYIHTNTGGGGDVQEDGNPNNKLNHLSHNNSNASLSQQMSCKAGPGSGTPSPPLAPKQIVTSCVSCNPPNHHQSVCTQPFYMISTNLGNGVPISSYSNPHQQTSLQPYANGVNPELYRFQRFPLSMGSGMPALYYGSQTYNPHHIHHNVNNNLSHQTMGNSGNISSNNANNSTKSSCYNCGQSGHKGNECKDSPMDSMTNSFKLNMKPKSDSE